jgi:GTP-binding protein YchF
VSLEDERIEKLASLANSAEIIPNFLEIVDIAGLVKGASKGEGLGNKFLSNIREVDAILHLVRCFEDEDVSHVENRINPVDDAEIINMELIMADLEQVSNIRTKNAKKITKEVDLVLAKIQTELGNGTPIRKLNLNEEELTVIKSYNFITSKPMIFLANVDEESIIAGNTLSNSLAEFAKKEGAEFGVISVKIEAEIAQIEDEEEKNNFLEMVGLQESGLNKVARMGFDALNLITYFTVGSKEARGWTVKKGTKAPAGAGVIHTDFERGFIRAEVISYNDYVLLGGELGAKDAGKLRAEGKDYVIEDGDVIHFRFNV